VEETFGNNQCYCHCGECSYGISADSGVNLIGEVSGSIVASAAGTDAAGIYVTGSTLYGATLSDAAAISGSVIASSSGASAAVLVWNSMNLNVTGTLTATGASAYAIRSGKFDGVGGFTDNTQGRVDRVELGSGAVLIGGVYLGDGDDVLTLRWDGGYFGCAAASWRDRGRPSCVQWMERCVFGCHAGGGSILM